MKRSQLNMPVALILLAFSGFGYCVNDARAVPVDTPSVVWGTRVGIATKMSAMSIDERRVLYSDVYESIGRVIVVDVETGSVAASYNINVDYHQGLDRIKSMHFLNDTSFMVVTSFSFYVLDSRTGRLIEDVGHPPATGSPIYYVAPMRDTDKMILGATRSLFKYDYKTRQLDTIYFSLANDSYGHTGDVAWIGLSDDERTVYSAGSRDLNFPRSGRICAWELATGRQLYQVDEPDSVYLQTASKTTHGSFIAALGINKAVAYDLRTGTLIAQYYDVAKEAQGVGLSRDGSVIGIHGDRRIDFYTTKNNHLFASMKAWPSYDIRFLDDGTSDVLVGKVDTATQRVRLNLSTSVNGDDAPQAFQCRISPNPSSSQTTLQIVLAGPAVVNVRLSATDGRVVSERSLGLLQSGTYSDVLQAQPGYYMCTVTAGANKQSLPVIIR